MIPKPKWTLSHFTSTLPLTQAEISEAAHQKVRITHRDKGTE